MAAPHELARHLADRTPRPRRPASAPSSPSSSPSVDARPPLMRCAPPSPTAVGWPVHGRGQAVGPARQDGRHRPARLGFDSTAFASSVSLSRSTVSGPARARQRGDDKTAATRWSRSPRGTASRSPSRSGTSEIIRGYVSMGSRRSLSPGRSGPQTRRRTPRRPTTRRRGRVSPATPAPSPALSSPSTSTSRCRSPRRCSLFGFESILVPQASRTTGSTVPAGATV